MDRRLLKQNYNESLAMSLLEILCSSRSSCSSYVLRVFFVFEGLWWKFFGALEAWIRRASLICDLLMFSDLWAWFLQTLGSRQMVWMICFDCSPILGLKFLKALRLDSCRTFSLLNLGLPKCLRKASIYRGLKVGEQHVAESDWWHMSQPDWSTYVIAYMCWTAYVITYTCEATCVIAYTYADAWLIFAWHLPNFYWFLNSDSET